MNSKVTRLSRARVGTLLLLIAGSAWYVLLAPTAMGGRTSYIRVSGESMAPTYHSNDLVLQRRQDNYEVGDVIAFRVKGGNVIHRIIGGSAEEGFVMKGDNNTWVDHWRPTAEEAIGKTWIHVPDGGDLLDVPRSPAGIGGIASVVAFALTSASASARSSRRRRQQQLVAAERFGSPTSNAPRADVAPAPSRATTPAALPSLVVLGTAAVLGVVLLLVAAVGWTRSTTTVTSADRPLFTQELTFDATANTRPSTLYPDGSAPVIPDSGTLPVFTSLAESVDVRYHYVLDGAGGQLTGAHSAELVVSAPQRWVQRRPLSAPQSFEGTEVTGQVRLDLERIRELIGTIEAETGVALTSYELEVRPRIAVAGTVVGTEVDEAFEAGYSFELTDDSLRAIGDVQATGKRVVPTKTSEPADLALLGISYPVTFLRWMLLPAVALLAAAALLTYRLRQSGQTELALIRARYGSLVVGVEDVERTADHVLVHSAGDLARVAKRDGGVILHEQDDAGNHAFLVQDGLTTFEYRVTATAGER